MSSLMLIQGIRRIQRKWRLKSQKAGGRLRACTSRSKSDSIGTLLYVLDSVFLRECLGVLTPGPDEELLVVSGIRSGSVVVPCSSFQPAYEFAHVAGVRANRSSSHEIMRRLSFSGHQCVAMFHSHPGKGYHAVTPSAVDIAAQERFERSGYSVVTGIFSRDGYVQFFANRLRFRLKLYGSDMRLVGKGLVRLKM